ncbi:hypothetical protein SVI_3491 [Shewanella violacea DSS12]|uniref:Uncharacterized protein n=1 Tax=Shewanella violacea (strain JCM 10179 / CIP 106290 / LMG 19151 / DSS12) TaxID=637905 RepID=D4ZBR7_SHEVD|nr:hypothetical protein SVI_3491 [Shewanella violacea DSS12]
MGLYLPFDKVCFTGELKTPQVSQNPLNEEMGLACD